MKDAGLPFTVQGLYKGAAHSRELPACGFRLWGSGFRDFGFRGLGMLLSTVGRCLDSKLLGAGRSVKVLHPFAVA